MNDFSTELVKSLYLDENKFKEMMRELLEKTVNTLLEEELSGFLGYERYAYDGRKSGDSRNGSYARTVDSQFGELHITVPRDRNGEFHQHTVPDYALYPSESAQNYREMLEKLKERGLKEVLLFVSDGLTGLPNALREAFPKARYQSCWVHLSRNVFRLVRRKDRAKS